MEEWLYHKFFEIESHHWWFVARERIVSEIARRRCRPTLGARVLDVGCGTGGLLEKFARQHDAVGIDSSRTAIELPSNTT